MKYLIIANGAPLSLKSIEQHAVDKTVLVLDGAADLIAESNIQPDAILGDFDSITETTRETFGITHGEHASPYIGKNNVAIIPAQDQNATDLHKGIQYADAQGAKQINIVCATGKRMDHELGNLRLLRRCYQPDRPMTIHTETQTLRFAKDETVTIEGKIGDYCGIMAFPAGRFSSKGLKYEVDDFELAFGFSESTCNQLREPTATITVRGEALIIGPQ